MTEPVKPRRYHGSLMCPHCGSTTKVRASRSLSALSRETFHQCDDHECGHSFKSITSVSLTIVPSMKPNPDIRIPLSEKVREIARALVALPTG
ncbi:ogr/Delta-like zinc finger family protein [Methylobacillus glycogenes]|uniref:ogr/Delta-like zinc finger family protein n=1 Tax=Methylobacillus glycogenes TaxID=406 RepID=UPI0009DF0481